MSGGTTHEITERRAPDRIIVMCSCGWSRSVSRRQNARARASQVAAARREHVAAVRKAAFIERATCEAQP